MLSSFFIFFRFIIIVSPKIVSPPTRARPFHTLPCAPKLCKALSPFPGLLRARGRVAPPRARNQSLLRCPAPGSIPAPAQPRRTHRPVVPSGPPGQPPNSLPPPSHRHTSSPACVVCSVCRQICHPICHPIQRCILATRLAIPLPLPPFAKATRPLGGTGAQAAGKAQAALALALAVALALALTHDTD